MKKIIKLAIENTTQIRKTEDSLCELYSHDKNNGVFEFEVVNETLGNEKPYAMFKFMDSQSVWKVPGTVEDNKIKILFDTTLITQDETVVCFLYLDDEERTTDFYRFKFKVKVSEIDKLDTYAVKERYFNNSIIIDKVDVVTKNELKEALKGLTVSSVEGVLTETRADELYAKKSEIYDDTDVKNRLKAIEDTQKDYVRTEDLPAPYDDRRVNERLEALETKADNDTVYNDTDLKNRVEALENRPNNGTAYDDSDLKRRVSELEQRPDNNTVYDDTDVKERLTNLETKVDKDTIYDDSALTQRVEALENKPEGATKEDVKGLTDRVVALENKSDKDTIYDDSDIKERLTVLENKPDNNTVYDDSALSNRVRALEDAPKINATDFATKNDLVAFNGELNNKVSSVDFEDFKKTIPAPYNDSSLVKRVETLETKQDKDTVYNDEPIKERLTELESKPFDSYFTETKANEIYAKKTDLPAPYNDKALSDRVLALENKPVTEIHGTGMPNGVVEAPIGATYIDTAKTNGALKWIKTTDGGTTGWKVVEGDTGWVLGWQKDKGDNKNRMYFRRKNDVVHVKFEPKISDSWLNHECNLILDIGGSDISDNLSIQGFQPLDNIVQTIFKRPIDIPGVTSGAENSEASQGVGAVILHYLYNDNSKTGLELLIATSSLSVDENHVNPFSYLTEDEWPTQLPIIGG